MLSGVAFSISQEEGSIVPEFVNQYILTDCLIASATTPSLKSPILPSIATMVNPASGFFRIIAQILRTITLVILSHFPGSQQAIKRISVANTGIFYHDGRALATCESGPPIRVQLPSLETVGWYDGVVAEGEDETLDALSKHQEAFGGTDLLGFMKEWTTGHPKIDPVTGEMILYHSAFMAPYIHYSILPSSRNPTGKSLRLINEPVPGVSGAKMAHDFGVSATHSVILDLSLVLDPLNLLKNKPVVTFDPKLPSRFGVFPRWDPSSIRWFETKGSVIFHTANSWDETNDQSEVTAVNMLACRLTSASLVYSAGNVTLPKLKDKCSISDEAYTDQKRQPFEYASEMESETTSLLSHQNDEEDQCRLYYYSFDISHKDSNVIRHQYALSAIPFEFPTLHPQKEMSEARYIYGCSTSTASFSAALGRAVKIDVLAKIDATSLIARGRSFPPRPIIGCVDTRTVNQVLLDNRSNNRDPIQCFHLPKHQYAQEARFVPRQNQTGEDDGYLLFYVYDEAQLDSEGECPDTSSSELWILDAKTMRDVVCKVRLPQRVPYGLHGNWFTNEQITHQRDITTLRKLPSENSTGRISIMESLREMVVSAMG
jgi:carotenoid cleavage dioxygenase-like enzyme